MKPAPSPQPALLAQRDLPSRLALGLLLALPLILFWPALFGGKMLWGADIQMLELVFKTAAARAQARGEWPLWMPEILCGMPGIAASNLVYLHPFELAIRLLGLPPWSAFGIESALEVALAGIGTWLFLRRLGRSSAGSLLGALAWALSGTMISLLYAGHINNIKALAAIPWVFWGLLKGWQERRWLGWGLAGAALAWQVLGLGLQVFAYTLIVVFAFVGWLAWAQGEDGEISDFGIRIAEKFEGDPPAIRNPQSAIRRAFVGILVCGVIAFCLAAPQLLPSLRYKGYSWRAGFTYEQFTSWSFHPKEALGWIVPGFYGWREPWYHGDWPFCLTTEYFGLLPWALGFAGVSAALSGLSGGLKAFFRKPEGFFVGLGVFAFLAGIGKHFPLHHLFYHLPVYNGFRSWTRFLGFLTFSVCVLSAFGWDALWDQGRRLAARRGAMIFGVLALAMAVLALALARGSVQASAATLTQKLGPQGPATALSLALASAYKAGVLALLLMAALNMLGKLQASGRVLLILFVAFHAADAGDAARRYLEFKDPGPILQRPAWLSVLPDGQGPEPFRILDQAGVWMQNSGALYGYETIQGYHGVQMSAPMKLVQALKERPLQWVSLMNGRYLLSPTPLSLPPGFKTRAQGPVYIYQNPYEKGRAFFLSQADRVGSDDEAFQRLAQPDYNAMERVTLDQDVSLDAGPVQGGLRWIRPRGDHLALEAQSDRRALLVLSQTWYPAWQAWVDGKPVPLLKADGGALSALVLEKGSHRVDLRYSPRLLQASGALALLGLVLLFWMWKREKKGGAA